jgi:hypothetical protein
MSAEPQPPRAPLCGTLRYVTVERVEAYVRLGWLPLAPLGEWSVLMGWPCQCEPVEPTA